MIFQKILKFILAFALLLSFSTPAFANNGWDYIGSDLRVDLPEVSSARDFQVWIATNGTVNSWDTTTSATSAWLGVYILPAPTFFQVGVYVNKYGYHWFAMTDGSQINCLEGSFWQSTPPYTGCMGDPYVYIPSNPQSQKFELVSYSNGNWIARVYDMNGNGHDVATISLSNVIINRINVTFEQIWGGYDSDLYNNAVFAFKHPQYMKWGTGFQDWPDSNTAQLYNPQTSYVYPSGTNGTAFCPVQYGAAWNFGNDPRAWYAGTRVSNLNIICNFNLFQFDYVPIMYNSP
jgi:hypothetical protein